MPYVNKLSQWGILVRQKSVLTFISASSPLFILMYDVSKVHRHFSLTRITSLVESNSFDSFDSGNRSSQHSKTNEWKLASYSYTPVTNLQNSTGCQISFCLIQYTQKRLQRYNPQVKSSRLLDVCLETFLRLVQSGPVFAVCLIIRLKILNFQVEIKHSQKFGQRFMKGDWTDVFYDKRAKLHQQLDEELNILRLLYQQRSLDYFTYSASQMIESLRDWQLHYCLHKHSSNKLMFCPRDLAEQWAHCLRKNLPQEVKSYKDQV